MKKIMKTVAAGISVLIGMSFMSVTASADMDVDYLLDENNIVWKNERGVRCYENGEMIDILNHEYTLYIAPAADVTAEELGVEFTDLSDWIYLKNLPNNTVAIAAENIEELMTLCDEAQNWYDEGLINYAYGFDLTNYGCVWGAEFVITLKEADKDYDPREYEYLEDVEFEHNDTYDEYTITEYDKTKLPEISAQISADERVETFVMLEIHCAVLHTAADSVLSLKRIFTGDVTGDINVNLYDAIEIAKHLMEMIEFDEDTLSLADYNSDGDVNLYDVIDIAKTLM